MLSPDLSGNTGAYLSDTISLHRSMKHVWAVVLLLAFCVSYNEAQRVPSKFLRNRRPHQYSDHRRTIGGLFKAVPRPSRARPKPIQTEYVNHVVQSVPFTYTTTPLPKVSPFYMIVAPDLSQQKPTDYQAPNADTYAPPPPLSYSPFQTSSSTIDYSPNDSIIAPASSTLPPIYSPKNENVFSNYPSIQQNRIQDNTKPKSGYWPPLFYNTIHGSNGKVVLL